MDEPRHISEMNFNVGNESLTEFKEPEIDIETKKVVNVIFMRLKGIIPAFNVTAANDEELGIIKREWALGFIQARLKDLGAIEHGLNKLRLQENQFMISVGQFIKLCQKSPIDFGIPCLEKAYMEACEKCHSWDEKIFSHPVVEHAYMETGSYNLANTPKTTSFPIFERNYEISTRMFMNGEKLRAIPKAIEDLKDKTITKEIGTNAIHDLRAFLSCKAI